MNQTLLELFDKFVDEFIGTFCDKHEYADEDELEKFFEEQIKTYNQVMQEGGY